VTAAGGAGSAGLPLLLPASVEADATETGELSFRRESRVEEHAAAGE
jgi:hypothetical protein